MPSYHIERMARELKESGRTVCDCESIGVAKARSRIYAAARLAGISVRTEIAYSDGGGPMNVVAVDRRLMSVKPSEELTRAFDILLGPKSEADL